MFSDGENESSREFINDLVWLEKRISEARTAASANSNAISAVQDDYQHSTYLSNITIQQS